MFNEQFIGDHDDTTNKSSDAIVDISITNNV